MQRYFRCWVQTGSGWRTLDMTRLTRSSQSTPKSVAMHTTVPLWWAGTCAWTVRWAPGKVWKANSVLTSPATVEPINRSKPWSGTLLSVELARFALGLISPHRKHVIYDLGILDTYHLTYGLDVVEPFVFL
jgi:hypothetical protein